MKIEKRDSARYPLKVTLSTGESLVIPRQSKFHDEWLRHHGCSLVAEYIALQFLGVRKIQIDGRRRGIYPINLLKWHKIHTPDEIFSKVTLRGVAEGINRLAWKGSAHYYKSVNADRIERSLKAGHPVILGQKNPIHSVILLPDVDGVYMASHGRVTRVNIGKIAKTATTNKRYRGMVSVMREREGE